MSVVILKFFNSDPKRSFSFYFIPDTRYFLVAMLPLRFMLYRCFIAVLFMLYTIFNSKKSTLSKTLPFLSISSFLIVHFRTLPLRVWKGYYTCSIQRMDPIMLFSFTSLRFVARPIRDTMRRFRAISPYFLVQITQFLLLPKRTHTIFHYRSNSLLRVATQ